MNHLPARVRGAFHENGRGKGRVRFRGCRVRVRVGVVGVEQEVALLRGREQRDLWGMVRVRVG